MSSSAAQDPRLTEQRNPASAEVDRLSPLEIVDLINAEDQKVAPAVYREREKIAQALEIAEDAFRRGGRLVLDLYPGRMVTADRPWTAVLAGDTVHYGPGVFVR